MPNLKVIELDVDMTFDTRWAKKHDGYLTIEGLGTEAEAMELSPASVFPWGPPVPCDIGDLFTMDPPSAYRGECASTIIAFRHHWIPIGAMTESSKSVMARGKRSALALTRMHRQKTMKNTLSKQQQTMSEAFKYLVMGAVVLGVISVIITGILFLTRGSPV